MKTPLRSWIVVLSLGLLLAACRSEPDKLQPTPTPQATATLTPQQLVGRPIKGSGSTVYRLMEDGQIRHIQDWATFLALGYLPGDIVQLPDQDVAGYPLGQPLTRWITDPSRETVYFMLRAKRYAIPDEQTMQITGGTARNTVVVPAEFLERFPLAAEPIAVTEDFTATLPASTAAAWRDGDLWIVDEAGRLTRWNGEAWQPASLAEQLLVRGLSAARQALTPTITAWALDPAAGVGWWVTGYNGLWQVDLKTGQQQNYTTRNSSLLDNNITDLKFGPNGTLWLTTPSHLVKYRAGTFEVVGENIPSSSFVRAEDGTVWLAGDNAVGQLNGAIYRAFDHPLLLDHFDVVTLDEAGQPWFVGRRHLIHFDGQTWTAYDRQTGAATIFTPGQPEITPVPALPSPVTNYAAWLQTWSRPAGDNGRCIHYLQYPAGDDFEVWEQITRLEHLGMRWVLVNYTGQDQLLQMAPMFARAGLMVIWRPFVRPYQTYSHWGEDVRFLRSLGLVPYFQVYNEPSLSAEWDGQAVDQAVYLDHLVEAVRQVYDAGGYVGLQQVDLDWTRTMLQRLKTDHLDYTFDRLFFVPHPYAANHTPDYDQDLTSVLGFQEYAKVFEQEIGFVPVMIAGEGGWRFGDHGDSRYPEITEAVLRDYQVTLFDWFSTGQLSNGDPLPDYLFAFCPWLLSDPFDPAGWYDSASGDRTLTIEGVAAMPAFTRRFSWEGN
jgi:hypothetical protein